MVVFHEMANCSSWQQFFLDLDYGWLHCIAIYRCENCTGNWKLSYTVNYKKKTSNKINRQVWGRHFTFTNLELFSPAKSAAKTTALLAVKLAWNNNLALSVFD